MHIQKVTLKNFRCFKDKALTMDNQFVIIHGKNGSGKSSILEALHYSCYLKSFRTHLNRDVIEMGSEHFFINIDFTLQATDSQEQVSIGFSETDGKLVKLNQRPVQSYKELIGLYRIVTLTALDLELVSGAPSLRRDFLNYALMLYKPSLLPTFRKYKTILENRNNLLFKCRGIVSDELLIWSEKLWIVSSEIQNERRALLAEIEIRVNEMLSTYFSTDDEQLCVRLVYAPRKKDLFETFKDFWAYFSEYGLNQELEWGRGQFGMHLDDFVITFENKKARIFASRGQQKLIAFLIKTAELQLTTSGEPGIFLLDDFLTDFDTNRMALCLKALQSLSFQVVITTPLDPRPMINILDQNKTCLIEL